MAKSKLSVTPPLKTSLKYRLRQTLVFKSCKIRIRKYSAFVNRQSTPAAEITAQIQHDSNVSAVDTPQATPARSHLPSCSMNVTKHQPPLPLPTHASLDSCIALQHHTSGDDQDIIIISTLPGFPFCCHEDLLHMSQEQLIQVANALNDRLPAALRIVIEGIPAIDIRHAIELIVGIRHSARLPPFQTPLNTPAKASPARSLTSSASQESYYELAQPSEHVHHFFDASNPPISPIDRHGNMLLRMYSPTCLTRLEERDEEDLSVDSMSSPAQRRIDTILSRTNFASHALTPSRAEGI